MRKPSLRLFAGLLLAATVFAGIVYAAVNPVTPPDPPHNNLNRATYVWGAGDELGTDAKQNAVLSFCSSNGVNVVYLDIWRYLGGANYSTANRNLVMKFVDAAHKSGIRVYALAGNLDWGTNHSWVLENIVQRLIRYQAEFNATYPKSLFDGVIYDVEYWVDEGTYPPATNLPGLCDLIRATRSRMGGLQVGCFAGWFLKDGTGTRPAINYNGKLAQDGEHLMDASDFVVVGSYRDLATEQMTLFQPWYDYASAPGKNLGLYVGSETTNVAPATITYFGQGKGFMETQHSDITNVYRVTTNSTFMGVAVHDYTGWKAMGP